MPTLTFIATKDNFLQSNAPNDNNGDNNTFVNISGYSTATYRALFTFDVSSLPENAIITSATFSLYYYDKLGDPSGQNAIVYKLKRNDWEELQSTWNVYKTGNNWDTAGALGANDYDSSLNATAQYGDNYGWINWDIKDIVENAIANVSGIVNLLLKFQTENGSYYSYHYSREYATDPSLRPKLVIDYEDMSFTVTDTVTMSETSNNLRERLFSVTDTINLTDTITVLRNVVINVLDTIVLTEKSIIKIIRAMAIKPIISVKSTIISTFIKNVKPKIK